MDLALHNPFPTEVVLVGLGPEDLPTAYLLPEESKLLSERAVPGRRNEFTLGRTAARQALVQLGVEPPSAIMRGENREPLWPRGITGSITHSEGVAIAAVARKTQIAAIGIDLEKSSRKSNIDISAKIALPAELDWIDGSETRLMMLFSAKEALFKALYPLFGDYFWHHQAELTWKDEGEMFIATLDFAPTPKHPPGTHYEIKVDSDDDFVFSSMILRA